ncbi:MAG: hypothetical protein J5J06_02480 [Phycisphaerae bacterium]|nr:hypothetical protein [Phycisphaerae bacterium]
MFQRKAIPAIIVLAIVSMLPASGCGTNFQDVLLQSGAAFGRSALDLFLTDLANALADALDEDNANTNTNENDNGNDNGNTNANNNGNANDNTNDNGTPGPGDVASGETIVGSRCAACHGADGASGFAPDIQGVDEAAIEAMVGGAGGHIMVDLSAQDIADVAAFLASF